METNNSYSVIRTGGKQYRVSSGSRIAVEKLESKAGDIIEITDVLLCSNAGDIQVGTPNVQNAKVTAKVLEHRKAEKKIIFKKKIRKGYSRKKGHRQTETVLEIQSL